MDLIQKFLKRLDSKRRTDIVTIINKLYKRDFINLDIKKLKGEKNLFRVRKGIIRIIYSIDRDDDIVIEKTEFRNDNTY